MHFGVHLVPVMGQHNPSTKFRCLNWTLNPVVLTYAPSAFTDSHHIFIVTFKLLCQIQPPLINKSCRILKLLWFAWKYVDQWGVPPHWVCDAVEGNCLKRFTPTRYQRSHFTPRYKPEGTYTLTPLLWYLVGLLLFLFSVLFKKRQEKDPSASRGWA